MQRHADEGAGIIDRLGFLWDAVPRFAITTSASTAWVPRPSAGEEIPLGARIIHVADALDAMLTSRIYRPPCRATRRSGSSRAAAGTSSVPVAYARSSGSCRSTSTTDAAPLLAV